MSLSLGAAKMRVSKEIILHLGEVRTLRDSMGGGSIREENKVDDAPGATGKRNSPLWTEKCQGKAKVQHSGPSTSGFGFVFPALKREGNVFCCSPLTCVTLWPRRKLGSSASIQQKVTRYLRCLRASSGSTEFTTS